MPPEVPDFEVSDVPLENMEKPRKTSTASALFGRFKENITLESSPDPRTGMTHGQEQTTFLGRKVSNTIVSAVDRKRSLAIAETDRNPEHLRMGESRASVGRDVFNATLDLDASSDEEVEERVEMEAQMRRMESRRQLMADQKREQGDWTWAFGWQQPKTDKLLRRDQLRRERQKRRHRSKRPMRELDVNLDAFNEFAQNSIHKSRTAQSGLNASAELLPSLFDNPGIVAVKPTVIDDSNLYLPNEDNRPRAVPVGDGFDALDVMADHIFRIGCHKKKWFKAPRLGAPNGHIGTGLTIRAKVGLYRTFPVGFAALDEFESAVCRLNPEIALKIKSDVVRSVMSAYM